MEAKIKNNVLIFKDKSNFFEDLVQNMGALMHIIRIDKEGHTLPVWTNKQYQKTVGYSLEERHQMGFAFGTKGFYHPDDIVFIKDAT